MTGGVHMGQLIETADSHLTIIMITHTCAETHTRGGLLSPQQVWAVPLKRVQ